MKAFSALSAVLAIVSACWRCEFHCARCLGGAHAWPAPTTLTFGRRRPVRQRDTSYTTTVPPLHVRFTARGAANDGGGEEVEDLRAKALRLREEAGELEAKLRSEQSSASVKESQEATFIPPPVYKDVKDSVWTFSYRFASDPVSTTSSEDEEERSSPPTVPSYGGKMTLSLRADGYTDLVSHEPSSPTKGLRVIKAWGWDLETSDEDEKQYILFSVDFEVPEPTSRTDRFYFQARQEQESNGVISLKEGIVTIKRDVSESTGGPRFWGFLSPKGILARFTYVGNFAARPTRK